MRISLPSGTTAELVTTDGATRGLVVIPDIAGLRPLFDDLCARLASEQGWTVCSPELYPGREDLDVEGRVAAASSLEDDRVLGDVAAAADATGCATVGVVGFCMGGMYAIKAAGSGRFHRAVPFYGMIRVPEDWRGPGQGEPLDYLASDSATPVLAIIGTVDPYTPPADVEAIEQAGARAIRYDGCDHGFVHDPARPAHNPDAAADAWAKALAFLSE